MTDYDQTIREIESHGGPVTAETVLTYIDALERTGRVDAAWTALKSMHEADPSEELGVKLAAMMCRLGIRDQEALGGLVSRYPGSDIIRAANAEIALIDGDYETGFRDCGYRWAVAKGDRLLPHCKGEPWDGKPCHSLVVIGEQGLGEECLFSAALTDLQPALVGCDARLVPLFSRSFPQHRFVDKTKLPTITTGSDRLVEAMSLYQGRTGNSRPWLIAGIRLAMHIRRKFQETFPGKRLVGVSWSSWRANLSDSKSIPPADLLPLLSDPDVVAVNLQYGDPRESLELWDSHGVKVWGWDSIDLTNDQDGLASLITAMDCVVTCSNSVAHLSAALGQRTILLAPGQRFVLWYWGKEGERTPWYPTVEIVRGPPRMAWADCAKVALNKVKQPVPQEC